MLSSSIFNRLGACSLKKSRCSLVKARLIGWSPCTTSQTGEGVSLDFRVPEHTKPPGMASTSTTKLGETRKCSGISLGTTGRSLTTESSPLRLHAPRPGHHTGLVQLEVGRVEEEHLPDLRVERIHLEGRGRRPVGPFRNGQLQLDAVGILDEIHEFD